MSIDLEVDKDGVATVTINRPEVHNALDAEHYAAISKAWQTVRDDPQIRCAILTGAGDKAFSAGADIKSVLTMTQNWSDVWLTQKDQLLNRGLEVWKPIIAAVNGFCVGGGMTMLFATDIRVASEHATFGLVRGQARHHRRQWRHATHAAAVALVHRHGDAADR